MPGVAAATAPGVTRIVARVAQGILAVECSWVLWTLLNNDPRFPVGIDYRIVVHAASRWLAGGPFYEPYQLAGPYAVGGWPVDQAPVMYPPVALLLFAPFTVLPAFLWWAIPAMIAAWSLTRLRLRWWAWPLMAALALYPRAPEAVQNGNPVMWAFAAGMAGAAYRWPWALALIKPTLAPFAMLGVRDRRWWLAVAILALLALPFAPLWAQYVRVSLDVRAWQGFLWHDWPLLGIAAATQDFAIP